MSEAMGEWDQKRCPHCGGWLDLSEDGLYRASFNYNGQEFSTIDSLEGCKDWLARFVRLLMPNHVNAATRVRATPNRTDPTMTRQQGNHDGQSRTSLADGPSTLPEPTIGAERAVQ